MSQFADDLPITQSSVTPLEPTLGTGWYEWGKPLLDFVLALIGLVALAPFIVLISIAIRLDSPGPAIFRQRRVGKDGREFTMYKFRTMTVDNDESLHRAAFERFFRAQ